MEDFEELIKSFSLNDDSKSTELPNEIPFCNKCQKYGEVFECMSICPSCGTVLNVDIISNNENVSKFNKTGDYVGDANSQHVVIDKYMKESSQATFMMNPKNDADFRLKKVHTWISMPHNERALYITFMQLQRYCNTLKLGKRIFESVKHFYFKIKSIRINRGSPRLGLFAAVIYLTCKMNNLLILPNDICNVVEIDKKVFTKGLKNLNNYLQQLEITVQDLSTIDKSIDRYVTILRNNLKLSQEQKKLIMEKTKELQYEKKGTLIENIGSIIYNSVKEVELEKFIKMKDVSNACQIPYEKFKKIVKS